MLYVIILTSHENNDGSNPVRSSFLNGLFLSNRKGNIKTQHYWPFVKVIQGWPIGSPHKGNGTWLGKRCHVMTSSCYIPTKFIAGSSGSCHFELPGFIVAMVTTLLLTSGMLLFSSRMMTSQLLRFQIHVQTIDNFRRKCTNPLIRTPKMCRQIYA